MVKKVLLIYNASSGSNNIKNHFDYIFEIFHKNDQQVTILRVDKNFPIEKSLTLAKTKIYKKIVIAGGDGTISKVVNTILSNGITIPVAIIPSGTSNDIATSLGYSTSIKENINKAVTFNERPIDIPNINSMYFFNIFTIGDLANISKNIDPTQKKLFGRNAYYFKGIEILSKIKSFEIKIKSKNFVYEGKAMVVIVINGSSVGGLKKISPNSKIDDGLLDVIIFKEIKSIEFPNMFFSILQGKHLKNKNIIFFQSKNIFISSKTKVNTDIDGEEGISLPVKLSANLRNLKLIY